MGCWSSWWSRSCEDPIRCRSPQADQEEPQSRQGGRRKRGRNALCWCDQAETINKRIVTDIDVMRKKRLVAEILSEGDPEQIGDKKTVDEKTVACCCCCTG